MMNTNDAVSLDFWNGLAFYSGKSFPCGTIGCDALNIPAEVIEKLKELCTVQYALINALTFGPGNPALLSAARESAQQIAKLLKDVKPFSYMDVPDVESRIERIFSEAYLNNAIEYSTVFGGSTLDILSDPKYEQGKTLLRTLPVLAQLGYSLEQYQQTMAVCMDCRCVLPMRCRPTWEDLAAMFEGSTASGAERACKKAVQKLTQLLIEDGLFHTIVLKRKSQKRRKEKIAAATYLYQADSDGEWGEIRFDFETKTAQIIRLVDWDKMISQPFAKYAISYLLNCRNEKLPKETVISFEE